MILFTVVILTVLVGIEYSIGRIPFCACGVGLWTSSAWSTETSQLFADPYSASHLLHGVLFFGALWFLRKKISLHWCFVIALLLETGWEILENSPLIIDRYRAATASLDYYGDSIFNSVGDVLFALLGFWIAYRLPWEWTLALVVVIELFMLWMFRDNLTLNVLMLIYPVQGIREWQMMHG